jgi:hypothetical protein
MVVFGGRGGGFGAVGDALPLAGFLMRSHALMFSAALVSLAEALVFDVGTPHPEYLEAPVVADGRVGIGGRRLGGGPNRSLTSCDTFEYGFPLTPDEVGYRLLVRLR